LTGHLKYIYNQNENFSNMRLGSLALPESTSVYASFSCGAFLLQPFQCEKFRES